MLEQSLIWQSLSRAAFHCSALLCSETLDLSIPKLHVDEFAEAFEHATGCRTQSAKQHHPQCFDSMVTCYVLYDVRSRVHAKRQNLVFDSCIHISCMPYMQAQNYTLLTLVMRAQGCQVYLCLDPKQLLHGLGCFPVGVGYICLHSLSLLIPPPGYFALCTLF